MKTKKIFHELKEHIPFTLVATLIAIIFVLIFKDINTENLFHIVHPLHLFASAIVSAGIFYKYKNNFLKALLIGITGSIIIGTLSDIIFPYLGGIVFQLKTTLHISLIEEPLIILGTAIAGSIIGITTKLTKLPHFIHVFLSVFASIFYLIAFSPTINLIQFAIIFAVVFVAVLIPCCISDIIFPLMFVKNETKKNPRT